MKKLLPLAALLLMAAPASAADAENGKRIYFALGCNLCHGSVGQGGNIAGPKLTPPLPLSAFRQILRNGAGRMPAYTPAMISDREVSDIIAYLETAPADIPASEIPLLNR